MREAGDAESLAVASPLYDLQGNTVISSAPSQRNEAFTDVTVATGEEAAADPPANGASAPPSQPRENGTSGLGAEQPAAAASEAAWSDEQELALVSNRYGMRRTRKPGS